MSLLALHGHHRLDEPVQVTDVPSGDAGVETDTGTDVEASAAAHASETHALVHVLRWVLRIAGWMLILVALFLVTVTVLIPRVGGATPYTVLTVSMKPDMPPGTLVVAQPAPPSEIGVGTVITYQLESGAPEVVTHRVVAVRTNMEGKTEFQTQGDANNYADEKWVRPEQIRGKLWYSLPHVGRVNTFITGEQRQVAVYGVAGGLGLYAAGLFVSALRDRTRKH